VWPCGDVQVGAIPGGNQLRIDRKMLVADNGAGRKWSPRKEKLYLGNALADKKRDDPGP
jgi:hypothetical protein